MNPLLQDAAGQVHLGWLMGITTAVFFVAFLVWLWWAWRGANRARWEEASRAPLNDDGGES